MLVAGMIGHEIDHYFNIASVRFLDQFFEVIKRTENRINITIVRHIVAHISLRRWIKRRKPNCIDAKRIVAALNIIKLIDHAAQVADAIAIRILKRSRIDLIKSVNVAPFFCHNYPLLFIILKIKIYFLLARFRSLASR